MRGQAAISGWSEGKAVGLRPQRAGRGRRVRLAKAYVRPTRPQAAILRQWNRVMPPAASRRHLRQRQTN